MNLNHKFVFAPLAVLLLALPACSVNVKKNNENQGDKKVDISTPVGAIHVSKEADVKNIGLAVYPGARPKEKEDAEGEEKSANVNIATSFFGLKVVAQEFQSNDPPDKIVTFYSKELKKYGHVLQCRSSWKKANDYDIDIDDKDDNDKSEKSSNQLTCENDSSGNATELKVGTKDNQHLVAVQSEGKGSKFALVFVQVRGKEGTI
jgi:hypothetical protein